MENLLKYFSLAPVLLMTWLSVTAAIIIVANYFYPDALYFPTVF